MLNKVKNALRVRTAAFDGEISGLIAACKADLKLAGITAKSNDPLIARAVILYAKANFGNFEDSERYQKAYDSLKLSLCLAGDYHAVV